MRSLTASHSYVPKLVTATAAGSKMFCVTVATVLLLNANVLNNVLATSSSSSIVTNLPPIKSSSYKSSIPFPSPFIVETNERDVAESNVSVLDPNARIPAHLLTMSVNNHNNNPVNPPAQVARTTRKPKSLRVTR